MNREIGPAAYLDIPTNDALSMNHSESVDSSVRGTPLIEPALPEREDFNWFCAGGGGVVLAALVLGYLYHRFRGRPFV